MRQLLRLGLLAVALLPQRLSAQTHAIDLVEQLYAAYAWETNDVETTKHTPLFSAEAPVMARYLDAPLLKAALRDRACEEKAQGICNLDFEPMWDSQDPGAATVEVVPTGDVTVVQARIHYPYHNETRIATERGQIGLS
jgi:hypothetical protein